MERNCPNCGAPKNGTKCEYCGTPFWEDQTILVADTPGFGYSAKEVIEKLSQWSRIIRGV